jgi:hypothetical protein
MRQVDRVQGSQRGVATTVRIGDVGAPPSGINIPDGVDTVSRTRAVAGCWSMVANRSPGLMTKLTGCSSRVLLIASTSGWSAVTTA